MAYYGVIPELVHRTISVTPGKQETVRNDFGMFDYFHIAEKYFGCYKQVVYDTVGNSPQQLAFIATPEKAILDLLYYRKITDLPNFIIAMRFAYDELDLERLEEARQVFNKPKINTAANNDWSVYCQSRPAAGHSMNPTLTQSFSRASNETEARNLIREHMQTEILASLQEANLCTLANQNPFPDKGQVKYLDDRYIGLQTSDHKLFVIEVTTMPLEIKIEQQLTGIDRDSSGKFRHED